MNPNILVTDQVLRTAEELIYEFKADESDVYGALMRACESRMNSAIAKDPGRNR